MMITRSECIMSKNIKLVLLPEQKKIEFGQIMTTTVSCRSKDLGSSLVWLKP